MTVGILYPSSNVYPEIGIDFIDGLKAFIKNETWNRQPVLLIKGIGFGISEKEIYEKAEELLRIEKADMLIAFIDLKVLPLLEPLVYSLNKLLLVVNAGANYPYNWVSQPNTLYLSLNHAFLCRLAGIAATKSQADSAAMASSFYDCGYMHTAAMVNGFTQQGGSIIFNFLYDKSYDAFDISSLTEFLAANQDTKKLLCVYDALPAGLLYQKLKNYEDVAGLELFVSPMMLEEKATDEVKQGNTFSITGYRPWDDANTNEHNQFFKEAYYAFTQKQVTIFSLLGWEAGLILKQICTLKEDEDAGTNTVIKKLTSTYFNSPRGLMKSDAETNYFLAPIIRYNIQEGNILSEIIDLETVKQYWFDFTLKPAEGVSSGWVNTYLCY